MMHWTRSGDLIVMVVLGGMASTFGPLIGAVTLLVLEETLPILIKLVGDAVRRRRGRRAPRNTGRSCSARCSCWSCCSRAAASTDCWRACAVTDALLAIDGLTKRFGGVIASDGIDLAVPEGELHAIIGPNGAGKTTLIGQLTGEIAPDAGRIHFAGQRHHRAAGAQAQPARARALVPDHVAVQRFHRARQRGARGAGACRALVPFLARCARATTRCAQPARADARRASGSRSAPTSSCRA